MTSRKLVAVSIIIMLGAFITMSIRNYQIQSVQKELLRLQIIKQKLDIENLKIEKRILLNIQYRGES